MFTKYIICLMLSFNSYFNDYFIEKIIGNPRMTNRKFLCINIQSEPYTGKILLNSTELFCILKYKWNNDPALYKKSIIKLIINDGYLLLTADEIRKLDILYVSNNPQIEKDSHLGQAQFIKKYFEYFTFRENVPQSDYDDIIAQLFEWRIVCSTDCENGLIGYDLPQIDTKKVMQRVIECMTQK